MRSRSSPREPVKELLIPLLLPATTARVSKVGGLQAGWDPELDQALRSLMRKIRRKKLKAAKRIPLNAPQDKVSQIINAILAVKAAGIVSATLPP